MDIDKYREEQKELMLIIINRVVDQKPYIFAFNEGNTREEMKKDAQNIITRYLNQAQEKETMDFIMDLFFNYKHYMKEQGENSSNYDERYNIIVNLKNEKNTNYLISNEEIVKVFFM